MSIRLDTLTNAISRAIVFDPERAAVAKDSFDSLHIRSSPDLHSVCVRRGHTLHVNLTRLNQLTPEQQDFLFDQQLEALMIECGFWFLAQEMLK